MLKISHHTPEPSSKSQLTIERTAAAKKAALNGTRHTLLPDCLDTNTSVIIFRRS